MRLGDLSSSRASRRGRTFSCKTALWVGVVPFCIGLLTILAFSKHTLLPLGINSTVPGDGAAGAAGCAPPAPCVCPLNGSAASGSELSRLSGKLTKDSVEKVLDAANSADPELQTVRVNQDALPSVFLFVGVLSGRGYRHRRLAVREAWANVGQASGESLCRFILSEDEKTTQVQKEVRTCFLEDVPARNALQLNEVTRSPSLKYQIRPSFTWVLPVRCKAVPGVQSQQSQLTKHLLFAQVDQHQDIIFLREKTNYKSILYKTYFVLEYAVANYDVRFVLKTDDDAFINMRPLIWQLRQLCVSPDCRTERLYMGKMAKESEVLLQVSWRGLTVSKGMSSA